jgi:hypothetical protein
MKLKEFKIDLGGLFPSKSGAVQRRAFDLGWLWLTYRAEIRNERERFLFLYPDGDITYSNSLDSFERNNHKEITAEKFLELTKEDVIEKEADSSRLLEALKDLQIRQEKEINKIIEVYCLGYKSNDSE